MIKIYKLNNELAGWIDLNMSEFDSIGQNLEHDGSFELDIILDDNETLANIDVVNETADVVEIPTPVLPTPEQNKATAQSKLAATDWVNQPDVYETTYHPHLLNRDEYLQYRSVIRGIAIAPTEGPIEWPTEPTPVWSSES